jgi:hypothetical protein
VWLDGRLVHVAGLGEVWERIGEGAAVGDPKDARAPVSRDAPGESGTAGPRACRWRLWWEPADANDPRHALCALQQSQVGRV